MTSSYQLGSRHPEARRISRGPIYVYFSHLRILMRCPERIGTGFPTHDGAPIYIIGTILAVILVTIPDMPTNFPAIPPTLPVIPTAGGISSNP